MKSKFSKFEKEEFWSKVDIRSEDDCWIWMGTKRINKNRYGRFFVNGTHLQAHRVAWIIKNGEIPPGKLILHKCDNPECVNPSHLHIGDHSMNQKEAYARGLHNPFNGEDNGRHKLLEADVIKIYLLLRDFPPMYPRGYGEVLANMFNVKPSTIINIKNKKSWKSTTDLIDQGRKS